MTDKPDLPLSAIRAIVAGAEAEILRIVERVRSSTGVSVRGIDLETIDSRRLEDPRAAHVPSRVRLKTEEI